MKRDELLQLWLVWKDRYDIVNDDTSGNGSSLKVEPFTSVGDNSDTGTNEVVAMTCDESEPSKCDEVRHNVNCSDTDLTIYDSSLII